MITELEQKFYNTFGIEEKENLNYTEKGFIEHVYNYPDITAEKLLEMICICSTVYPLTINFKETIDELKEFILDFCIRHNTELGIEQIKSLFIGGDT